MQKVRCDRHLPRCTNCQRAHADCLVADVISGRNVPQDYLKQVETRILELEKEFSTRKFCHLGDREDSESASHWGSTAGISFWRGIWSEVFSRLKKEDSPDIARAYPGTSTVPSSSEYVYESSAFELPTKGFVEGCLQRYFEISNAQVPVFHREAFIEANYEPLYGPLSPGLQLVSKYTELNLKRHSGDPPPGTVYSQYQKTDLNANPPSAPHVRYSLYFLLQVLAISTSMMVKSPALSIKYHKQAMQYYSSVLMCPDRRTALRAVILLGIYCLARPAFPGLWHVSGMSMRMCIELGLHNEENAWSSADPLTKDDSRRLFWCAYILDRQVSMLMGRPIALPHVFINTRRFALADDSLLQQGHCSGIDWGHLPTLPSYKHISEALINLLEIQQKIKGYFYDTKIILTANPQPHFEVYSRFAAELDHWYCQLPTDDKLVNFDFQTLYLDIDYHITRVLLIRVATSFAENTKKLMQELLEEGTTIMRDYCALREHDMMNYSWVSVNNIFIAVAASLYALLQLTTVSSTCQVERVEDVVALVDGCMCLLQELQKVCAIAAYCHDSLQETKKIVTAFIQKKLEERAKVCDEQFSELAVPNNISTTPLENSAEHLFAASNSDLWMSLYEEKPLESANQLLGPALENSDLSKPEFFSDFY